MPALIAMPAGQVFGRLTVLRRGPNFDGAKGRPAQWWCRCSCGTETLVTGHALRKGLTRSCGCLRRETTAAANRARAAATRRGPNLGQ
jgi:hypothetical protein